MTVAAAADLLGNGAKSLAYGTRQGGVWFYPHPTDTQKRWYRRFGDRVDLLAVVHGPGARLLVVAGGETQWITALDPTGARAWAVYLDAAVAAMAASPTQDRLFVAGVDRTVHELDAAGRQGRRLTLPGTPVTMATGPTAGVIVGTREGSVFLVQ